MKTRKLRGHNRIHKEIELWKQENLYLDLDYLKSSGRDYCKVWISPFSDMSLSGAGIPTGLAPMFSSISPATAVGRRIRSPCRSAFRKISGRLRYRQSIKFL